MFKKCQKHVKIISIKDQKQNEFFCEDENVQFSFIGTKIKIRYIYRDEKTYLTLFNILIKNLFHNNHSTKNILSTTTCLFYQN